jgi:hypothetical protein
MDELLASRAGTLRQVGEREASISSQFMTWGEVQNKKEAVHAHRRAIENSASVVDQSFLNDTSLGNISLDFFPENMASTRPRDLDHARGLLQQAYQQIDKLLALSEQQKRRIEQLNTTCKKQGEEILFAQQTRVEQMQVFVPSFDKQLKQLNEEKERLQKNVDDMRVKAAKADLVHQTIERELKKQADL